MALICWLVIFYTVIYGKLVTMATITGKQTGKWIYSCKMSNKTNNSCSKSVCERFNKHSAFSCYRYSCNGSKMMCRPVKKVIPSKNLEPNSLSEVRSCPPGVINNGKKPKNAKPKKTTKSDIHFDSQMSVIDFCKQCGDSVSKTEKKGSFKSHNSKTPYNLNNDIVTQVSIDQEKNKKKISGTQKMIQQFYKNENFKSSVPSMKQNHLRSNVLDPIKESTDGQVTSDGTSESALGLYSETEEELGYLDPEDEKTIKELKDFRKDNYFECHSAKSRVSSKGSVTSLNNHKCIYRFYLNDRLFPVPLNSDHQNNIRCVECHLPLKNESNEDSINGTIQTKVKIGNDIQDLIVMLPVKNPLIVQEKRNLQVEKQSDVVYFGVVKLNYDGDSIFSPNHPNDSYALRYQKGYKEYHNKEKYVYEKVKENDVIII